MDISSFNIELTKKLANQLRNTADTLDQELTASLAKEIAKEFKLKEIYLHFTWRLSTSLPNPSYSLWQLRGTPANQFGQELMEFLTHEAESYEREAAVATALNEIFGSQVPYSPGCGCGTHDEEFFVNLSPEVAAKWLWNSGVKWAETVDKRALLREVDAQLIAVHEQRELLWKLRESLSRS